METRVAELRGRADRLWDRHQSGAPLSDEELEALVEATFRLGVHPDTPHSQALALLWRAHRLDVDNPKHAYHLGRLYLAHGRLDQAATWLAKAAELAPSSHRIWTHISIAERMLHARRQGDQQYSGNHLTRARAIAQAVQDGRDDHAPQRPVVARFEERGRCRWPGINDVELEGRLGEEPSELDGEVLAADLEHLADLAGHRRGGAAAFSVLAVQWLVYGHPPAEVRRLAALIPEGPALDLLLRVCDLAETPREDLAPALAACLASGEVPALTIALLHQRHLLASPPRLPSPSAHASAATAVDHAAPTLEAATTAPSPAPEMAEKPVERGEGSQGEGAEVRKQGGEAEDELLEEIASEQPPHAKGDQGEGQQSGGTEEVDDADGDLNDGEGTAGEESAPTNGKRERVWQADEADGERGETEEAEEAVASAPSEPSEDDRGQQNERGQNESGEEQSGQSERGVEGRSGLGGGGLSGVVEVAAPGVRSGRGSERLDGVDAWASLDGYPSAVMVSGPLAGLREYVAGRRAEERYRLGDTAAARAQWHAMLMRDPLNLGTLHNLAVAHTAAGDLVQAVGAWQAYLEAHYVLDLAAGSPRGHAERRAELHRALTTAFGTAALGRPVAAGSSLAVDLPLLLASRSKVTTVTEHLRLEMLNRTMAHRNPLLLLGASRNATPKALDAARDRCLAMVERACSVLPARIGPAFAQLCAATVERAYTEAPAAQLRPRTAADERAEGEHLAWLTELLQLKAAIQNALHPQGADSLPTDRPDHALTETTHETTGADRALTEATRGEPVRDVRAEWALTPYVGDLIGNLRLLDAVTLDPADEFVRQAARQLDPDHDPQAFLTRHDDLTQEACRVAATTLLEHVSRAADNEEFPRRFALIGASWVRNGVPDTFMHVIDDPTGATAPTRRVVQNPDASTTGAAESTGATMAESRAVQDNTPNGEMRVAERGGEAALLEMRRWVARLPGSTAPARALARTLSALGRRGEARTVLEQAREGAFSDYGRAEADLALAELAVQDGRCDEAVEVLRALAGRRPGERRLPELFFSAYQEWIRTEPGQVRTDAIVADLSRWDDEQAVDQRRVLCVEAVLTRSADLATVLGSLRELRADDQGNLHALAQEVFVLHAQALQERGRMRRLHGQPRKAAGERTTAKVTECVDAGHLYVSTAEAGQTQDLVRKILAELGH